MTDSKTPDWAMAAADDVWTALANNEANGREAEMALFSQALLSAYERGRKEGIEEAARFMQANHTIIAVGSCRPVDAFPCRSHPPAIGGEGMNMREKIARAACEAGHHASWPEGTSYTNRDEQRAWFKIADAVLDALMEPTWEMEGAGIQTDEVDSIDWVEALMDTGITSAQAVVSASYKAMLKAAKEGK